MTFRYLAVWLGVWCVGFSPAYAEVGALMTSFVKGSSDRSGMLVATNLTPKITVSSVGAIKPSDELRGGCPVTKPVVCYLILKYKIDLQRTIDAWFPEKDGNTSSEKITVAMLMLNTSGIRDYVEAIMGSTSLVTPLRTVEIAYRKQALLFAPGTGWEYSNTNFNLLGLILEKETKKSLGELVRLNFSQIAPSIHFDDGASRYPGGYANPWPYHWSAPAYAGGLVCTAEDTVKLFAFLLKQEEFSRQLRSYDLGAREGGDRGIGLGLYLDGAGSNSTAHYFGDMLGCVMNLYVVDGGIVYFHYPFHATGVDALERAIIKDLRAAR